MNNQNISNFFLSLEMLYNSAQKTRETYNEYNSPDFNFFNYHNTLENNLSDILADLLNPNGSHGQKDIFLQAFFHTLNIQYPWILARSIKVVREYPIKNGRFDILVYDIDMEFFLIIENKWDSSENSNQVKKYLEYSNKEYKNFLLVYLTKDGAYPKSLSIAYDHVKPISYETDIIGLIAGVLNQCKSGLVKAFLENLSHFLSKEISEKMEINNNPEFDEVTKFIVSSNSNLGIAYDLWASGDQIINQVYIKFFEAIIEILKKNLSPDYQFRLDEDLIGKNFTGLRIYKKAWQNDEDALPSYSIRIEKQRKPFSRVIYGIAGRLESKIADELKIKEKLDLEIDTGFSSKVWPWYRNLPAKYKNWDTKEMVIVLNSETEFEAKYLSGILIELILKSEDSIDKLI